MATRYSALLALFCGSAMAVSLPNLLCPPVNTSPAHYNDSFLPNPFVFNDGLPVLLKTQWTCRANEISQTIQKDELGILPPKPQSLAVQFVNGNTLNITVTNNGKSINFAPSITYPANGTAPFPAFIAYDGGSIPYPDNVAVIYFDNDEIAQQNDQSSRGVGKFFDLFGTDASAGAMTAWAWAVSRIIDALEKTPQAKINVNKLGVTGCSRNGKGALVAGAFDSRIALTIPQESGSGGAACWRISDWQLATGTNVQTAHEIVQENVWFSTAFDPFVNDTSTLPVDHHLLAGLVAPRGLFVIENTAYDWLGTQSTNGCMRTGRKVFEALGVADNMGFSQIGNHLHCDFPASQQGNLTNFIDKFLFNKNTDTNIVVSDGNYTFNEKQWINWPTPNLI
ncbi:hypothetical protein SISNIDRAFT_287917 [Sistotremastrum niveocremeum HHB9708]|uniref:(4-O-methyl)-D-glucuronate--lignin esterase n=2 Tax=Sistotremastraceae TaxID=3402574 RepID=A0A164YFT0_9AGAM|nr:hypothetical protein SISNIDRAFT_287917 [Sistotremastrum niveocremeum HHB9708]KZT43288.1 hypothetical protein SISSUDRAFT_1029842 [Sistotremastrum suecicum HHB10207 ss-3]